MSAGSDGLVELAAALWAKLRAAHPARELERVGEMLRGFAGSPVERRLAPLQSVNPRLFVPGLAARPWHEPSFSAVARSLSARFELVRAEALDLLRQPAGGGADVVRSLQRDDGSGNPLRGTWRSSFFQRHFRRAVEAYARFPITARTLDGASLSREAMFSVLYPGAHVLPHSDGVNFVITLYLPLVIPPGAWIRFGTEARLWREGECLAVDSTFDHESANPSPWPRVILIVDEWHPDLTATERRALAEIAPHLDDRLRALAARRAAA